ncbi:MAG: hypothetical protein IKT12_04100 [Thermoguttaceae bacterium]|nr:hypothetical protein [Thermoguttaceae bacterium]
MKAKTYITIVSVLLSAVLLSAGCRKKASVPTEVAPPPAPAETAGCDAAEFSLADLESAGAKFVFEGDGRLKSADFTEVTEPAAFSPDETPLWKSLRVLRGKGPLSDTLARQMQTCSDLTECLWLETVISPAGLQALSNAGKLKKLRLTGMTAEPEELQPLQKIASLAELDLSAAVLSDEAMGVIARFPALTRLNLYQNRIGDAGVENLLPSAERLVWLNLDDTQITDAAGPVLCRFKNLKFLHLGRTKITDEIIDSLAGLKSLETIHVTRTGITEEGAARLREALPGAQVISVVKEN